VFENGGFKSREDFIDESIEGEDKREKSLPSFAGYGSPVNTSEMQETLEGDDPDISPFNFI
jgi:hypothetical protein